MSSTHAHSAGGLAAATPFHLLELIGYQEGAVVSRTLVHHRTGTVTLFAFDEEQGLSEHTAPYDALAHVLEGSAEITISGKPLTLTAGDVVLMPAQQPHALHALSRFKMLLTMIHPE